MAHSNDKAQADGRRLEVTPEQLHVVCGKLALDDAMDALLDLLVDHWLETRRPDGVRRIAAMPTDGLQGASEDAAETMA